MNANLRRWDADKNDGETRSLHESFTKYHLIVFGATSVSVKFRSFPFLSHLR